MRKEYVHVRILKKNRKLLIDDCKREFIRYYPDFGEINLTTDFMLERVCLYYLDRTKRPSHPDNAD